MTFYNKDIQYRVTLDTDLNLFVVFDKENTNHVATGVTIEQAVQELKKICIRSGNPHMDDSRSSL
ncbi:hypothetical protein HV390_05840 [Enterococcus faecium]|nr:hypothetical protein [Enterococcus faecium]NVE87745.1 hypothetical protein [Enterococcus faecium]